MSRRQGKTNNVAQCTFRNAAKVVAVDFFAKGGSVRPGSNEVPGVGSSPMLGRRAEAITQCPELVGNGAQFSSPLALIQGKIPFLPDGLL